MGLKEWLDILDGIGSLGLLLVVAYMMRKDNSKVQADLEKERDARIIDLKSHNENSESLLEKVLVALQDNQRFLETSLTVWKQEIKDELNTIKEKIIR